MKDTGTINASGPSNRMPVAAPVPKNADFFASLIDGWIKDKWIAPEDRDRELAGMYRSECRNLSNLITSRFEAAERKAYQAQWVDRWIEALDAHPKA